MIMVWAYFIIVSRVVGLYSFNLMVFFNNPSEFEKNLLIAYLHSTRSFTVQVQSAFSFVCRRNSELMARHILLEAMVFSSKLYENRTFYLLFPNYFLIIIEKYRNV